jgi:CDP-glycerol glycerophosphotransferase (TagB/SpsB family)
MISDHSSIAFEYMLLDRPIVVVDCPDLIQRAAISADKVRRLHAASDVVTDVDGLIAGVARALQTPVALSLERRRTAAELFFKPGTATDRALNLIYDLVGLPRREAAASTATSPPAFAAAG